MTGEVIPEGLGGQHTATVKVIDRVFDAASGTFGVRLELPNKRGSVPGGHPLPGRVRAAEAAGAKAAVAKVKRASAFHRARLTSYSLARRRHG